MGERMGWRSSFLVLGVAGLVLAGIARLVLRDAPRQMTSVKHAERHPLLPQLKRLVSTPSYLLLAADEMIVSAGVWMFLNWMPLYFKETFGLSLASAGLSSTMALQGSASLGLLVGGSLSDRIAHRALPRRMLLMGLSYIAVAPCTLFFMRHASLGIITVAIVVFSFGRAFGAVNEDVIVCDLLAPHDRSTGVGLLNMMNCFSGGFGILLAGLLSKRVGLAGMFACVSGLMLLAAAADLVAYYFFLPRDLIAARHVQEQSELEARTNSGPFEHEALRP